jgi:hypothetical protein
MTSGICPGEIPAAAGTSGIGGPVWLSELHVLLLEVAVRHRRLIRQMHRPDWQMHRGIRPAR